VLFSFGTDFKEIEEVKLDQLEKQERSLQDLILKLNNIIANKKRFMNIAKAHHNTVHVVGFKKDIKADKIVLRTAEKDLRKIRKQIKAILNRKVK
jgi:hypothetical protein